MSPAFFLVLCLQQQNNTWVESPLHILTVNLTSSLEFIIFAHNKVSMTSLKDNCIKGWKGLSGFLNQNLFPWAGGSRKQPLKYLKNKTLNGGPSLTGI